MANPEEVERAKSLLRPQQWLWGDPGSRMHETGLDVAYTLYQALNHPCCGWCNRLSIEPTFIDGKNTVNLSCRKGHSPKNMWDGWAPGEPLITCTDCTDPEGRPPKIES